MRRRSLSPSLVVAMLALFVALGGSAFAVSSATRPLVPCANGTIKGYATFDLDGLSGSLPGSFSTDAKWFRSRYDCRGAAAQIRAANGGIEVKFPGLTINAATASVYSGSSTGTAVVNIVGPDTVRLTLIDSLGSAVQRGFSLIVS